MQRLTSLMDGSFLGSRDFQISRYVMVYVMKRLNRYQVLWSIFWIYTSINLLFSEFLMAIWSMTIYSKLFH